ncbi:cysteine proteinase [Lepidopterella palustris CBS 459.81]|uniref:Cysteine proteinase n=1 Tax=Lepidopterella palustris CBS 459.81 TaxID=1314670 RepID=A0A8E2EEM8_9PEZI|nr:cysteine proteinase [Lepidopterella palustris CBS 459.81]
MRSQEMDRILRDPLPTGRTSNTMDSPSANDDGADELALLEVRTERGAAGKNRIDRPTEESSAQVRRPRALLSELLASANEEQPERRLRTLKQDRGAHSDIKERNPSTGRVRRTRLSTQTNKSQSPSNLERSPSPFSGFVPIEEKYSINPGLGPKWPQPVIYPPVGRRRATVEFDDIPRLDDGEFLNDNLIDFYMIWAYNKANLPPHKVYFFNTYFFTSLSKTPRGERGINYAAVQRWTAKEDIFNYDYVVVPINEDAHWYVAIICNLTNINRVLYKEPLSEDKPQSSLCPVKQSTSNERLQEPQHDKIEDGVHKSGVLEASNSAMNQKAPASSARLERETNHVEPLTRTQTEGDEQIKYEGDEEWPDSRENRRSAAASPFSGTGTAAMERLSLQDESAGGILADSIPKTNIGEKKKGKRKSGPPLKKHDPDEPIIIVLDSLGVVHSKTVRFLKDYIAEEGKVKRNIDAIIEKSINPKDIPTQNNFCDCGVFLLGYLDKFFVNPREFVTKILTREMDLEKDWPDLNPKHMRSYIRDLLFKLAEEQQAERRKLEAEKREKRKKKISPAKKEADKNEGKQAGPSPRKVHSPSTQRKSPQIDTAHLDPGSPSAKWVTQGSGSEGRKLAPQDSEVMVEVECSQPKSPARRSATPHKPNCLGSSAVPIEIVDSQPSHTAESHAFISQLPQPAIVAPAAEGTRVRRERRVIDVDDEPQLIDDGAPVGPFDQPLPFQTNHPRPSGKPERPSTRGKP